MAQYRFNIVTNQWVIIAEERGKRPQDFIRPDKPYADGHDDRCPFCPGREDQTPPEIWAARPDDTPADSPDWKVRVVPNKFPFLGPDKFMPDNAPALYARQAAGSHEIVIESTSHTDTFGYYDNDHAILVVDALRQRYLALADIEDMRHICIFKNHGRGSGASLPHPHFQIAASTIISPYIENRLEYYRQFVAENSKSPFEVLLDTELKVAQRVIIRNNHFVALCPFASMTAFEVYIIALHDCVSLGDCNNQMLGDLADILQFILQRLTDRLNNPDYNIVFHSAAVNPSACPKDGCRFYLQIYPRLTTHGGYELATHTFVNAFEPKLAAKFYRNDSI